jgi:hypothetical protein
MIRAMLIPELAQTRKRGLQAGAKRGRAIAAERSEAALSRRSAAKPRLLRQK